MKLDRRCVPEESIAQVYEELEELARRLKEEDPRFHAVIRDVFEGANDMPHLPFATDPENPLVQSAKTALRREQELRHESSMTDAEIPAFGFSCVDGCRLYDQSDGYDLYHPGTGAAWRGTFHSRMY